MKAPRQGNDAEFMRWLAGAEVEDSCAPVENTLEIRVTQEAPKRPPVAIPIISARTGTHRAGRLLVLQALTALLLVACAAAWGARLVEGGNSLNLDATTISNLPMLEEALAIGPLLYVVANRMEWDRMSDTERSGSLRGLELDAARAGYDALYLIDENGEELGLWNKRGGAALSSNHDD